MKSLKKKSRKVSLLMLFIFTFMTIANLNIKVAKAAGDDYKTLGDVKEVTKDDNEVTIKLENEEVKITFYKNDLFRLWMDPDKDFDDPTKGKIIDKTEEEFIKEHGNVNVDKEDAGDYYKITTEKVVLRIYKSPMRLALYKADNKSVIWEEESPLKYNGKKTIQTLKTADIEQFYGGGVQNGYFSHKNKKIDVKLKISHWNDGSVSNPVPFYMSSKGYGVFRNTFKPGQYDFKKTATMAHDENRFDAFYFAGGSFDEVMNGYTELTGRPQLMPNYSFYGIDADCYKDTMDGLEVVKGYVDNDIPRGVILPNDGYGCGYTDLKGFVDEASKSGFKTGLWTENDLDKLATEVKEYGVRAIKTDVAWVGPGYEFAFDAVESTNKGIENNSDARSYVVSICGWAGTQKNAAVWSGDQSGDWEYIRMHIPTYIGGGMSGMPYIGSDIDGIFGGSAKTYTRDLQWKTFTPTTLNMSGWASKDKQPWIQGEPYTSINRVYLKLKSRMLPYMYTYANESYKTGAPMMRGMVWAYPEDPYTFGTETQYQYMLGKNLLVAPVYEDTEVWNEIYLPDENQVWIDYFTGEQYNGRQVINNFDAPLWKLPLFVKNGAIIPMYPESNYAGEVVADKDHPITFDIYPSGKTSFELYEDDGESRDHREGAYAKTLIESNAPNSGDGKAEFIVNPTKGNYAGIQETRKNEFSIHTRVKPENIKLTIGGEEKSVTIVNRKEDYDNSNGNVAYFDENIRVGPDKIKAAPILFVKTEATSIRNMIKVEVDKFNNDAPKGSIEHDKVPVIPTSLQATKVIDKEIIVGWNEVENATSYDLMINNILYTNVKSPYTHDGLKELTDYEFKVRAANSKGASEWSNPLKVSTIEDLLKNVVPAEEMKATASSEQPGETADKAVDGDIGTLWHTKWGEDGIPAEFVIDMSNIYELEKFEYVPRPKGSNGNITKYNLSMSLDGVNYMPLYTDGVWKDDGATKIIKFEEPIKSRYLKIDTLAGNGNFASAHEFRPYKVEGTNKTPVGDYTGDNRVDNGDLVFIDNYMGVKIGDNDWNYAEKADLNFNGYIDAYDYAFVASKIGSTLVPSGNEVSGKINLLPEKKSLKKGEEIEVKLVGTNLKDVYAFDSFIKLNSDKYELVNCTGSCGKDVVFTKSGLTKNMDNVSSLKIDDKGTMLVATLSNRGNIAPLNNDGTLGTFKIKAKVDTEFDLKINDSRIVGTDYMSKDSIGEVLNPEDEIPELKPVYENVAKNEMKATATSEETGGGDTAAKAIDGNVDTMWHTPWFDPIPPVEEQVLTIEFNKKTNISKLGITPRKTGDNGVIKKYEVHAINGEEETLIGTGGAEDIKDRSTNIFELRGKEVLADKIEIRVLEGYNKWASIAEVDVERKNDGTLEVESVQFNKENPSEIRVGEILEFGAHVLPKEATNQYVSLKSSNEEIIKINKIKTDDGVKTMIEGIKAGKAIITATSLEGNKEATTEVIVKDGEPQVIPVVGIKLDKTSVELEKGSTETIKATITPENATNKNITWSSLDEKVAVIKDGVITAIGTGTTKILATSVDGGFTGECIVTVKKDSSEPENPEKPNKDKLKDIIDKASALKEEDYTQNSFDKVLKALESAKSVMDDEKATDKEIENAIKDLEKAMEQLEKPGNSDEVDKEKLKGLLKEALKINKDDYTEESFDKLLKALESARLVMTNNEATQKEVDKAIDELNKAIDKLVKVNKPNKPGTPNRPSNPTTPGINNGSGNAGNIPSTGFNNTGMIAVAVILIGAGFVLFFYDRKRKINK
ncbi:discoidin domain-containing protein [Clostridium sardiniense]|uniref:Discoidin domain-containing protein n=1 Tax=Clostridium sardiniense TaxID=29369 RepID=A0ABS7KU42_CLOSR|nr:discoidin domain-containing protein [Clostridium sardiniense]MBY0754326.1 discoidin domain-containing protein [Clostridium sardiniense]MDQ0461058.1 alpha-glucosidase (family GH31 glycosyl hydrolase) [Clostridium sardiniense]